MTTDSDQSAENASLPDVAGTSPDLPTASPPPSPRDAPLTGFARTPPNVASLLGGETGDTVPNASLGEETVPSALGGETGDTLPNASPGDSLGEEKGPVVGVGVAVIEGGSILLVQRGREPGRGLWAVPGGKVRVGEPMKEAARREVREETGIEVEVGEVVWVGEFIEGRHHIVLVDFAGSVAGGELRAADDALDARWVPLDEATGYPLTPTMYDLVDTLRP